MTRRRLRPITRRFREARQARGYSQIETAFRARIEKQRFWLIENGYRSATTEERARLARVLRVSTADLFDEDESELVSV